MPKKNKIAFITHTSDIQQLTPKQLAKQLLMATLYEYMHDWPISEENLGRTYTQDEITLVYEQMEKMLPRIAKALNYHTEN